MYYGLMTVHHFEFPFTEKGLIVEPRDYALSPEWIDAVETAHDIYDNLECIILDFHHNHLKFKTYQDAWLHVYSLDSMRFADASYCRQVQDFMSERWLRLPQDIEWYIQAADTRLNPVNPGYVYLVQSPTGHYKIGRTKNVNNRLATFGIKLPFEIELLHTIWCADYSEAEKSLHAQFADKWVNGEWFTLDDEDVVYIKSISRM